MELPDFIQLSDEERAREVQRQEKLRREFHSRVRLSSAHQEAARAVIFEQQLREAFEIDGNDETADRLADNLAMQGRFIEAAEIAVSKEARSFYSKAADAIYLDKAGCECTDQVAVVGQHRIRIPVRRVIKEVYSVKHGGFGFLTECATCGDWIFLASDPTPTEISDMTDQPNDLERLKV